MRGFLRISGLIILILLFLLLWSLKRVDYSPYMESRYYDGTMSRLDSLRGNLSLATGGVMVGFGSAVITPGLSADKDDPGSGEFMEIPLAGYGSRKGACAEGIHDSLFVKAVAVKVGEKLLVIVGSDILIVPPIISERVSWFVKDKLGLNREQLIFSANHTHSGISTRR